MLFSDGTSEPWFHKWELGNRGRSRQTHLARDIRPWGAGPNSVGRWPVDKAEASLHAALVDIEAFAREQKLDWFAGMFAKALDAMGDPPVRSVYHRFVALLRSCCQHWAQALHRLNACLHSTSSLRG